MIGLSQDAPCTRAELVLATPTVEALRLQYAGGLLESAAIDREARALLEGGN